MFASDPFSLVVLPDTQFYSQSYPNTFIAQTQWVVDNLTSRNIAFVSHLGDIVQSGESGTSRNQTEWQRADAALDRLDGNLALQPDGLVPYSVVLGNHDYRVVSDKTSGTTRYQEFFGPTRYAGRSWYLEDSSSPGAHAQIFSGGGYRFLNLTLQFEPTDADLTWAQSIIERHPGMPTILNTHSYLNPSSRRRQASIQGNSGGTPNQGNTGEQVFQKLVYLNPQIFLVMNGHFSGEYSQVSTNVAGQEVLELVVDYQSRQNGGDGWMRLMSFRPDDNRIDVQTYSPTRNEFEIDSDSQFSFALNFVERFGAPIPSGDQKVLFQTGRVVGGTVYSGTIDTQLRQASPTTTYGTGTTALLVDASDVGGNNTSQVLLQYANVFGAGANQIPLGAQILDASLIVESTNPGAGGTFHRMLSPWNNASTWNSMVNGIQANNTESLTNPSISVGSSLLSPLVPIDRNLEIDVTQDFRAWASGVANYGWAILPWANGTDGWAFSPSESANQLLRPRLRVQWIPPSGLNAVPVLSGSTSALTFIEDSNPIPLFGDVSVVDPDSNQLDTGTIQVDITSNASVVDRIDIVDQGMSAGQIGVLGNGVFFGGLKIGLFGGGVGLTGLSVLLNENATLSATQALLRSIHFRNNSNSPSTSDKKVRLRLFDGDGGVSNSLTRPISISPTNDIPVIKIPDRDITFAAGGDAVPLSISGEIEDVDSVSLNGGQMVIAFLSNGTPTDTLFVRNVGTETGQVGVNGNSVTVGGEVVGSIAGGTSGSPLIVTWNSSSSPVLATRVLRAVAFSTTSQRLAPEPRSVQVQTSDGQGGTSQSTLVTIQQSQVRKSAFQQGMDTGSGVYNGAGDLQLSQSNPSIVYPGGSNASEGLLVDFDSGTANSQVLLRFDSIFGDGPGKIPLGSKILDARLVLKTNNPGDGARFHRMRTGWNSLNETWATFGNGATPRNGTGGVQPNDLEASLAYDSQVGNSQGNGDTSVGRTTVGVLADVQAWSSGEQNHGWAVIGWDGQTNGWAFSPSESSIEVDRPKLEIDWVPTEIASTGFRQGENGYVGVVDTRLQQDFPNTPGSTALVIESDYNSPDPNNSASVLADQSQALLRFNNIFGNGSGQIPNGAFVHAASLTLASLASDSPGDGGQIFRMNSPWQESATWNSFSNGIQADGLEASSTQTTAAGNSNLEIGIEGGWNQFDVTSDLREWINGNQSNHGWAILPWNQGSNAWGIQSSESASLRERPKLQVFYTPVGIAVVPTNENTTSESGQQSSFSMVLKTPPKSNVTIALRSSDPTEGQLNVSSITFTPENWDVAQVVQVSGRDDNLVDGDVTYSIITEPAISDDPNYVGFNAADISLINEDNDVLVTPSIVVSSGSIVYSNSLYVPSATITGNNDPLPSLSFVFYSDAAGTNVIDAPENVGTYFVRAFSAANAGNNAADSAIATFNITPYALTASGTAANKVYDALNGASVTINLAGVFSGDTVTVSASGTFADKNVANGKTVTIGTVTLAGADAGNYTVGSAGTATANVTPATLVASITANNKPFDNTTAATIASRSLGGILGTDVVTVFGGSATFADKGVGNNKTVNATGLTIGGADAGNYTFNATATTQANITPTVFNRQLFYKGSSYASQSGGTLANPNLAASTDTSKVLARSSNVAQTLNFANNVINSAQGINGIVLDIAGLVGATLTTADFGFRVSPTGAFNEAANPPSGWATAPVPTLITVMSPGTPTTPARVRIEWNNNQIQNQWLQIRVLPTANTGLPSQQTFYLGHLLGEVNGLAVGGASGSLQVTNADINVVRPLIGTNALVTSAADITKNGLVQNSDITQIRSGVGVRQLRLITIPVSGSGGEGTGNGGGNGGSGGDTVPGPAPEVGAPIVSPTVSVLGGSLGAVVEGLVRGGEKQTAAASLSQPVVAVGTIQSSSNVVTAIDSAIQSTSREAEGVVDDLFAGLANEELGKFFK